MVIITGLTASGKSALAHQLADNLPSTLISADSVQFYRGFDIGSAKPGPHSRQSYDYRCLDFLPAEAHYSAVAFARCAEEHIVQAWHQSRIPVVVGGTGLYIRALLQGMTPITDTPQELKKEVRSIGHSHSLDWLHRIIKRLDPAWGQKIHPHDRQRTLRAWEILLATGEPPTQHWQKEQTGGLRERHGFRLHYWILLPERNLVRQRIEQRTRHMFRQGWLEEVAGLLHKGVSPDTMPMKSVGYRQIVRMIQACNGDLAKVAARETELRSEINTATWHYAKRQRTWFRREKGSKITRQDRAQRLVHLFVRRTKGT